MKGNCMLECRQLPHNPLTLLSKRKTKHELGGGQESSRNVGDQICTVQESHVVTTFTRLLKDNNSVCRARNVAFSKFAYLHLQHHVLLPGCS